KPNLDYPSGPAYNLIGSDTEMFTPLFVAARITGWTAHLMEQLEANSLIRPPSPYNGPEDRHPRRRADCPHHPPHFRPRHSATRFRGVQGRPGRDRAHRQ